MLDGLLDHVDSVKRAVSDHRCDAGVAENGTSLTPSYSGPLPERCSAPLLERMMALLPPQVDCEVMLEYLVQEVSRRSAMERRVGDLI